MSNRKVLVARTLAAFVGLTLAACGAPEELGEGPLDEVVETGETTAALSGGRLLGLTSGTTPNSIRLATILPANGQITPQVQLPTPSTSHSGFSFATAVSVAGSRHPGVLPREAGR